MFKPVIIESPYAPKGLTKPKLTKADFDDCNCVDFDYEDICDNCNDYMDWDEAPGTNLRYCRAAMVDCLNKGEVPFASHLLYTQDGVLDDTIPEERQKGIEAGFSWRTAATKTVVYLDLGMSRGMEAGIKDAVDKGSEVEYRTLGTDWEKLLK